ncbi:MAG: hypothetical protein E7672_02710 [Ruminococcaceae bacterium]|nr:hypothetical protein [Oscillospiraceae bacterium]
MNIKKRLLSILLASVLCLTCVSCSTDTPNESENESLKDSADPVETPDNTDLETPEETEPEPIDPSTLSDEEYFSDYFTPILRFVVASDVHIDDEGSKLEEQRLGQLFDDSYAYSDAHAKYNDLDGVFFVGDIVSRGTITSMNKFFSIVDAHKREGTVIRAVLGNHEYYDDPSKAESNLMEAGGYDSPDVHLTIDGYHFILISPNMGGEGFDETKQNWLAAELKIAAEDDPTGTRPIFVFNHQHVSDTVYGSQNWGVKHLRSIFNEYPQVVDFSGHSHYPINDPRSVWQGEFTALGTGSLSYYEMGMVGKASTGIYPGEDKTYWWGESEKDAAQFYIVEVDENNAIKVQGYDLFTSSFIMEPLTFRSVGDPSTFKYTDARKDTADKPVFADDAEIVIDELTAKTVTITFPQAICDDTVQNYRIVAYKDGKLSSRVYRLSCSFYFPTPETLSYTFKNLKPSTEYILEIIATSPWGVESDPFTISFTTPENPEG